MTDTVDNTLAASIRSLRTVVIPAVDSSHPLATEQADLIVKTLTMLREQLPARRAKAKLELDRYIALGEEVAPMVAWTPDSASHLEAELQFARQTRQSAAADHRDFDARSSSLASAVSAAVRRARLVDADTRAAIEQRVLAASIAIVDDDLDWFAPQGWSTPEPDDPR